MPESLITFVARAGQRILLLALVTIIYAGISTANAALFVPDSEPWSLWAVSDESNAQTIDHSAWQTLLDRYLDAAHPSGINRFDYAAVSAADRATLNSYLVALQAIDPRRYRRAEQRAYWINLYNATTVALIIEHYPVKTIRKVKGGLFGLGPWNESLLEVAGVALTLNDIEHRILRPIWVDRRIHYAVSCASLGCPNLAAQVYTPANTDALLEAGARAYINHPRGAAFHGGNLQVSSIYKWYQVDFGDSPEAVVAHLRQYAAPPLAGQLATWNGKLRYDYDWNLNAP